MSPINVATVKDGLVTPIANGDCVVTVTCGSYNASCNVSVSCFEETSDENIFAKIENGYLYLRTYKRSNSTLISARSSETDTTHSYYSIMSLNPVSPIGLDDLGVESYFNGEIPYYGSVNTNTFISGIDGAPDFCYSNYNTESSCAITVRTPLSSNFFSALQEQNIEWMPFKITSEYTEYVITDEMIDAITGISGTSEDGDYYKGFLQVPTNYQFGINITAGFNSLSYDDENWFVNVNGGRLNYQILKTKIASNTVSELKAYLKQNRLRFWI